MFLEFINPATFSVILLQTGIGLNLTNSLVIISAAMVRITYVRTRSSLRFVGSVTLSHVFIHFEAGALLFASRNPLYFQIFATLTITWFVLDSPERVESTGRAVAFWLGGCPPFQKTILCGMFFLRHGSTARFDVFVRKRQKQRCMVEPTPSKPTTEHVD